MNSCVIRDNWLLFDVASPEADIVASHNAGTLKLVCRVFDDWFGKDYPLAHQPVSVLRAREDFPQCFRRNNIIFLSANPQCAAQLMYQFAHELCHLMIPHKPPERFRWFEESVCEAASIESLRWILGDPESVPDALLSSIPRYILAIRSEYKQRDPQTPLSAFISAHIEKLECDPQMRSINGTIAEALQPFLIPEFWKAVPLLCEIPPEASFHEGIRWWVSRMPRSLGNNIAELLIQ